MSADSLIGMVRFVAFGTEANRYGKTVPKSLDARYEHVIAAVGGTHHMLIEEGADHAKVLPNEDLEGFQWRTNLSAAQTAFKKYKAEALAGQ